MAAFHFTTLFQGSAYLISVNTGLFTDIATLMMIGLSGIMAMCLWSMRFVAEGHLVAGSEWRHQARTDSSEGWAKTSERRHSWAGGNKEASRVGSKPACKGCSQICERECAPHSRQDRKRSHPTCTAGSWESAGPSQGTIMPPLCLFTTCMKINLWLYRFYTWCPFGRNWSKIKKSYACSSATIHFRAGLIVPSIWIKLHCSQTLPSQFEFDHPKLNELRPYKHPHRRSKSTNNIHLMQGGSQKE